QTSIFSDEFLLSRPLLQAIRHPGPRPAVLLIDEIDRADEEFEAFLLEILSEWQITIPEIGSIKAEEPPYVILTGNRTRELSDAVRRRCFYLWIDYPEYKKELAVVRSKVPDIDPALAEQICRFMELIRQQKLEKVPGVSETLDWGRALVVLHQDHLDPEIVSETLGIVFKDRNDVRQVRESLSDFLERLGVQAKAIPEAAAVIRESA
ncbi:MAG: MoxR family ATPase, partial [SAR324 cluster bacterium]|nr:MoxR family ATPase [SAR324 cluster bacterium]